MKKYRELLRYRVWSICLVTALLVSLVGCVAQPPPERLFSMETLIIDVSVFPEDWWVGSGPRKVEWDHRSSSYGSWYINFQTDTSEIRNTAGQHVYRYANVEIAKSVFEDSFMAKYGDVLPVTTCRNLAANQNQLHCYDYEGRAQTNCQWAGRYDEFIVVFGTWMIPERMSLDDMQEIICAIDAHVGSYFDRVSED